MQTGGLGSSAAGWLAIVGKTQAPDGLDLFAPPPQQTKAGQKEPANPAVSHTQFPTAPPVNYTTETLLALQQAEPRDDNATNPPPSAEEQFLDYMKKSPEERMRDKILKALGVTEDDIANMSPDERLALESRIRDMIKEALVKAEVDAAPEREQAGAAAIQQRLMTGLI